MKQYKLSYKLLREKIYATKEEVDRIVNSLKDDPLCSDFKIFEIEISEKKIK